MSSCSFQGTASSAFHSSLHKWNEQKQLEAYQEEWMVAAFKPASVTDPEGPSRWISWVRGRPALAAFLQPGNICVGLGSQVLLVLSGVLRCPYIRQPISSRMQHVTQSVFVSDPPSGSFTCGVAAADANMSVDNAHNSVQASLTSSSSAAASSNPLDGTAVTAALADAEGSIMYMYGTTRTRILSDELIVASMGMVLKVSINFAS